MFEWSSGLQYRGQYVGRKRHGYGVQQWPDGARYEGHFHEDQRHGSGRHGWSNGEVHVYLYWRNLFFYIFPYYVRMSVNLI